MPIIFTSPVTTIPWDLTNAVFDTSFGVSAQEPGPHGMAFSSDGTKMYICGSGQTVYQYTLSTAFDISSASYASLSKSVSGQDSLPGAVSFKSDGTKMYVFGAASNTMYQYTLSTAWNVSTATYDTVSWLATGQDLDPTGMTFKDDGTKLYLMGNFSNAIYQYSLPTPWDIGTVNYDSVSFSTTGEDFDPHGVAFSSDGLAMFMVGNSTDTVYQYTLGTAWVVSSAVYDSISIATGDSNSRAINFNAAGTRMYVLGGTGADVRQFDL